MLNNENNNQNYLLDKALKKIEQIEADTNEGERLLQERGLIAGDYGPGDAMRVGSEARIEKERLAKEAAEAQQAVPPATDIPITGQTTPVAGHYEMEGMQRKWVPTGATTTQVAKEPSVQPGLTEEIKQAPLGEQLFGRQFDISTPEGRDFIKQTFHDKPAGEWTPQEVEMWEGTRQRLQSAQNKLTPKLFELYPEAEQVYNEAVGKTADKRSFKNLPSYQLNKEEMIEALGGEEEYKQFMSDSGTVSIGMSGQYDPKMYNLGGTKEKAGDEMLYGLRAALLTQYQPKEQQTEKEQLERIKAAKESAARSR